MGSSDWHSSGNDDDGGGSFQPTTLLPPLPSSPNHLTSTSSCICIPITLSCIPASSSSSSSVLYLLPTDDYTIKTIPTKQNQILKTHTEKILSLSLSLSLSRSHSLSSNSQTHATNTQMQDTDAHIQRGQEQYNSESVTKTHKQQEIGIEKLRRTH
jgi:hypothetical protein